MSQQKIYSEKVKHFNFISTVKEKTPFDFEDFKREAIEGLYAGKKMGGADGVFSPMLKHLLESMFDGHHLQESKASGEVNRRNGKTKRRFAAFGRVTFVIFPKNSYDY